MAKYWGLKNRGGSISQLFKSEEELFKKTKPTDTRTIVILDAEDTGATIAELIKQKDRDSKLRGALGELEIHEEFIISLINLYQKVAPDGDNFRTWTRGGYIDTTKKEVILMEMKKLQFDKSAFQRYIVNNKKYFIIDVCNDKEWYKALLRCHGFINPDCNKSYYDYNLRKYVSTNLVTEEIVKTFYEAKRELRKKPTKKRKDEKVA
jgi:hypothetical protein